MNVNYTRLQLVPVTPAMAARILETCNETNYRRMDRVRVHMYARSMTMGLWDEDNGTAIIMRPNGQIADGQHRLAAVVMSGRTMRFAFLVAGSEDAHQTLDNNKTRATAAQLTGTNTRLHAGLIAAAYRYGSGQPTTKRIGILPNELRLLANDLTAECATATKDIYNSTPFPSPSAFGAAIYLARLSGTDAAPFFEAVRTGAGLVEHDPANRLRTWCLRARAGSRIVAGADVLAVTIKALNDWTDGRTSRRLLVWKSCEAFPVLKIMPPTAVGRAVRARGYYWPSDAGGVPR